MEKAAGLLLFLLALRATCLRGPLNWFGWLATKPRYSSLNSEISNDEINEHPSQTVHSQPVEAHKLSNDEINDVFIQAEAFARFVANSQSYREIEIDMKKRTIVEPVMLYVIKKEHRENVEKLLKKGRAAELVADDFVDGREPIRRTLSPLGSTAPLRGSTVRFDLTGSNNSSKSATVLISYYPDIPYSDGVYYPDIPYSDGVFEIRFFKCNVFRWTLTNGKWERSWPELEEDWKFLTDAVKAASSHLPIRDENQMMYMERVFESADAFAYFGKELVPKSIPKPEKKTIFKKTKNKKPKKKINITARKGKLYFLTGGSVEELDYDPNDRHPTGKDRIKDCNPDAKYLADIRYTFVSHLAELTIHYEYKHLDFKIDWSKLFSNYGKLEEWKFQAMTGGMPGGMWRFRWGADPNREQYKEAKEILSRLEAMKIKTCLPLPSSSVPEEPRK